MRTVQNQLLLKLSHFLSGQIGRWEVVAWAKDVLTMQNAECRMQNHGQRSADSVVRIAERGPATQPGHDLVQEILSVLSGLPDERTRHYSLVRASLNDYRRRLEEAAVRHTLP
jgi:hypothetical protein